MAEKSFAAVICEYNPFHRGHLFQLENIKKRFPAVVCIMSGDLVQRGETAVAGKYIRARAALECGADLVLELPAPWCCSSAADFARAGVHIAKSIGASALAFGAEGDEETLFSAAALCERREFTARVGELAGRRENKLSYPAAFTSAVREFLGEAAAGEFSKPNNILALEYLKSLRGSGVEPFVIPRAPGYESSGEIRALEDPEKMLASMPENARGVYRAALEAGDFPRGMARLDSFFVAFFRTVAQKSDLSGIYSMTDDLAAKLLRESRANASFSAMCAACVDKKHTLARVRRAAVAAALGWRAADVKKAPLFTTLLAADPAGCGILASLRKKECGVAIVTKPADAPAPVREAFALNARASDLASLAAPRPRGCERGETPFISCGV